MKLTIKQAAKKLNCHPETIRRWCKDGKIDYIFLGQKKGYRVDSEIIERCRLHRRNKGGVMVDPYKDLTTTNERLRELRRKARKSILTVSLDTGITPEYISKYEKNRMKISVSACKRLARYYGVTTDYILCMDVYREEEEDD